MPLKTGGIITIMNNKFDGMWEEAIVTYCTILLLLPRTPQLSWYDAADAGYVVELPWSGRGNLGPHSLRMQGTEMRIWAPFSWSWRILRI